MPESDALFRSCYNSRRLPCHSKARYLRPEIDERVLLRYTKFALRPGRGGGVAYCTCLENRRRASVRRFESCPLLLEKRRNPVKRGTALTTSRLPICFSHSSPGRPYRRSHSFLALQSLTLQAMQIEQPSQFLPIFAVHTSTDPQRVRKRSLLRLALVHRKLRKVRRTSGRDLSALPAVEAARCEEALLLASTCS